MPWTNPITGTTYTFPWQDAPVGGTSPTPLTSANLDAMQADEQDFDTATASSLGAFEDTELAAETAARATALAAEVAGREAADARLAAKASPTFTGLVKVPVPSPSDDSSAAAPTAWIVEYVEAAIAEALQQ